MKLFYLLLLLAINFSCGEKEVTETENSHADMVLPLPAETLRFSSGIRAIFQDTKGNYWFGSHNEGVCCYDGESCEYFTTGEGLQDNQIRSIQEDQNGVIWLETARGVSSYDGKTITNHPVTEGSESEWKKSETDLWFGADVRQGINRYDGNKMSYLPFPNPRDVRTGNLYAVTSLSKGRDNMIWIGTYAGVWGYNGSSFTILNDETIAFAGEAGGVHVRSILEDSKGRLWIGNNGVGVILKQGDSIIHFSKEQGKLLPMQEFEDNFLNKRFADNTGLQSVFAIEEDADGNIWFGDRDSGAWKYDGETLTNYVIDNKVSKQMIWDIYRDHAGKLLFGMSEGGVYQYNGESFVRVF